MKLNQSKLAIHELVPVSSSFFQKSTIDLAHSLLGCVLVKETPEGMAAGLIVEPEAYMGPMDRAAHSYQNRRTKRTEIMFAKAEGMRYVKKKRAGFYPARYFKSFGENAPGRSSATVVF